MGLDTVEIVLATEEIFAIELPDDECGQVVTVGDLYHLVLGKLELLHMDTTGEDVPHSTELRGRNRLRDQYPCLVPWVAPDVWATLSAIIQDQLQVDPEEIIPEATFLDDLRCD